MKNKAIIELEEAVQTNRKKLDSLQEELESLDPGTNISRDKIEEAGSAAAIETLRFKVAALHGGLRASDCQPDVQSNNPYVLITLAQMWKKKSVDQLRTLLVEKKKEHAALQEEKIKKEQCLKENQKLLEMLMKEKESLDSKQEELENQKIAELEDKLAKVKRLYGAMKIHLKNTVETYFPDPEIPGLTGIYSLLNDLTRQLQNREREAYIRIPDTIWPYHLEILEKLGIIERHPSDHSKIRIIDFSDGRLGS